MATIVLCTLPLTSSINATLKLAKSLEKRGHRVVFCGMADGEAAVASHGFAFIPVFEDWFPKGFVDQWVTSKVERRSWRDQIHCLLAERKKLLQHERYINFLIQGGYKEFQTAIRSVAPDLLLVDTALHTYWALMAYRSGVQSVYYSPILPMSEEPLVPPCNSLLRPGTGWWSRLHVRLAWKQYFARRWLRNKAQLLGGIADWVSHLKRLARACDYPLARFNTRTELMPLLDLPMYVMCPQAFNFPEAGDKPRRYYIEASIDLPREEPAFPWQRLHKDKQLIYCSLGSIASSKLFCQCVIDAVAREPNWQLVMNIGSALMPTDFQGVPEDTILVRRAPQLALLRQANVMINHGGIGTVKECLFFGVPQVVFPIYFDQPGAAARVAYHGLGTVGNFNQTTPDSVYALLTRVLRDQTIRTRVDAMSRVFQSLEAEQPGIALIERLLATTP